VSVAVRGRLERVTHRSEHDIGQHFRQPSGMNGMMVTVMNKGTLLDDAIREARAALAIDDSKSVRGHSWRQSCGRA
jgi:hypothetical protein